MENIHMDLRLFDANTQVTTQQSLTEEMKTFYSDYLIDAATPDDLDALGRVMQAVVERLDGRHF